MSRPTNKYLRTIKSQTVVQSRAVRIGWKEPFETLPLRTQNALRTTGNIRVGRGDQGRKSFHQHGSGYSDRSWYASRGGARALIAEVIATREARAEIDSL